MYIDHPDGTQFRCGKVPTSQELTPVGANHRPARWPFSGTTGSVRTGCREQQPEYGCGIRGSDGSVIGSFDYISDYSGAIKLIASIEDLGQENK